MDPSVKIEGLDSALKAMAAAFPKNPEQQRKILNQSMAAASKESIVPIAKQRSLVGDASGSLSESIAPRAKSKSKAMRSGAAASMTVTPVRSNRKAIAKYINYYKVKDVAEVVVSGIRHGHLVEFGTVKTPARPFLYPALKAGFSPFMRSLSKKIERKVELAVKRKARKK